MDFSEPIDLKLIREAVSNVCRDFPMSTGKADREGQYPQEFYDAMAEAGWIGIAIPEAYGGAGKGVQEAAVVLEQVAASGAAMNGATPCICPCLACIRSSSMAQRA